MTSADHCLSKRKFGLGKYQLPPLPYSFIMSMAWWRTSQHYFTFSECFLRPLTSSALSELIWIKNSWVKKLFLLKPNVSEHCPDTSLLVCLHSEDSCEDMSSSGEESLSSSLGSDAEGQFFPLHYRRQKQRKDLCAWNPDPGPSIPSTHRSLSFLL